MAINYIYVDMKKLNHYEQCGSLLPCPDQYVGELIIDTEIKFVQGQRDNIEYLENSFIFASKKKYHEKNILIILESPHRFEYDASNDPIGLVMGKTGWVLFSKISKHLEKSRMKIQSGSFNLIICNAVQYQSSCGKNPIDRDLRNENWMEIYEKLGGKEDLKKRIFAIKPRYTLNLCTGGRSVNGLRYLVSQSLGEWRLIKYRYFTEGNHPASWDMNQDDHYKMID